MFLVFENQNHIIKIIILKSKKYNYSIEEKIYIFYYSKNTNKKKFAKLYTKI
jgi:hypothetical protein